MTHLAEYVLPLIAVLAAIGAVWVGWRMLQWTKRIHKVQEVATVLAETSKVLEVLNELLSFYSGERNPTVGIIRAEKFNEFRNTILPNLMAVLLGNQNVVDRVVADERDSLRTLSENKKHMGCTGQPSFEEWLQEVKDVTTSLREKLRVYAS